MDPNALAGMIFTLLLFMLIGGFIVLLPLTRRLGTLIESKVAEKQEALPPQAIDELVNVIRDLEVQVRRLSDRQEFTEQLLESGDRERLLEGRHER